MLTDSYGQKVTYPALTDRANAQTMGAGIVEGVVPRSVMRFPTRNHRGATITSPVAGMVAWVEDVKVLEVYDGSAWNVVAAGSSTWKTLSLRSGYAHDGTSAAYRIVNLFGERTIMFRGGITITYNGNTAPGDGWFSTLSANDCPAALRRVSVACSVAGTSDRTSVKLDINPNGGTTAQQLKFIGVNGANAKPQWVSLDGAYCSL